MKVLVFKFHIKIKIVFCLNYVSQMPGFVLSNTKSKPSRQAQILCPSPARILKPKAGFTGQGLITMHVLKVLGRQVQQKAQKAQHTKGARDTEIKTRACLDKQRKMKKTIPSSNLNYRDLLHIQMNPRKSKVNDGDHQQHADGNSVEDISPELNEFCKLIKEHLSIDEMYRVQKANGPVSQMMSLCPSG